MLIFWIAPLEARIPLLLRFLQPQARLKLRRQPGILYYLNNFTVSADIN